VIYIFWSSANLEEAKRVVRGLVETRLIACASLFPVTSIYRWEGKVEEGQEVKVVLKTQAKHFAKVEVYILEHGSYKVPEIVSVEVSSAHPAYLKWLTQSTKEM